MHLIDKAATKRPVTPTCTTVCVLASVTMLIAAFIDHSEIYRLSLASFLFAGTTLVTVRSGASHALLSHVRQDGYDDGFAAGCKAMRNAGLADRPLTLLRTPQQLLQEDDLASGTDGVR